MNKKRVALLCGGESAEHEVSVRSARSVAAAMGDKYHLILIGIDKRGQWRHLSDLDEAVISEEAPEYPVERLQQEVDVVFPVLHGPFGEDGTVQGLLALLAIPFVGSGVLASAVAMDKDVSKRLFRDANIPQTEFIVKRRGEKIDELEIIQALSLPLFVKPANLGSSVGVSKVKKEEEFEAAIEKAFEYDDKIILEAFAAGREIECALLGNEDPRASLPAELIPRHEFYTYEAKYLDPHGADYVIPAELSSEKSREIQELAIRAFQCLGCRGMARVDFFLLRDGTVLLNEVNTIPGFTSISLYPQMWQSSGLSYEKLIDQLIELAGSSRRLGALTVSELSANRA